MWKQHFILVYLVTFILNINYVWSFNMETQHYTFYQGRPQSMFGYSVAEYRDSSKKGWVIIGAPNNRSDDHGVGGAVVRCDIANDKLCYEIKFDSEGTRFLKEKNGPSPIDNKANQWLGASLSTSMIDGGPIVACAPKYHWFGYSKIPSFRVADLKDPVGACWLTKMGNDKPIEFAPCRDNDTSGHNRQGMCQAGIGVSVTKDGRRLFIGAPGSYYWQGQLFTVDTSTVLPYFPQKTTPANNFNSSKAANLLATQEGPAYEDNSYLGYSVAVGDFLGQEDSGVAVGVPRGFDLNGKVLLFNSQLFNHKNISGSQMGAYFGYALAVNDIDGDQFDDLIISAPFYTQPELAGVKIETGRIYVYYQGKGKNQKFTKFDIRDGENNRGQFGLSVASLGDIDRDGYGDFVVGEPYGGPYNRGAVYIYRGTKDGVEEKYSQAIFSENLEKPVTTFGWSVSGGMDLDNNLYPDMVVGAYESNAAVLFRSRPVITVNTEILFLSELIDLNKKACVLDDGSAVACTELKVCCSYTGLNIYNSHIFHININLDDKKKNNPRLFFLEPSSTHPLNVLNKTVQVQKTRLWCETHKVYVRDNLRDKLTSLDAEMQVELAKNEKARNWHRNPKENLLPILGVKNVKKRSSLSIQKNCGSDNICVPNLVMNVNPSVSKYNLSSHKKLELYVKILNLEEDAFESSFYLQVPNGMDYVNVERHNPDSISIQCTAPKSSNNNTLKCDVGNPLTQHQIADFKIVLQPDTKINEGMKPFYELHMKVNSTNPEKPENLRNNFVYINLPLLIESSLVVESESRPSTINMNSVEYANIDSNTLKTKLELAPSVVHNYTIRNNGPSTALNITATLYWTAETPSRDILLYLLEQPQTSSEKVHCDSANADYHSIKDKIIHKNQNNTRSKRQIYNNNLSNNYRKKYEQNTKIDDLFCKTRNCVYLQCHLGPLAKDEEISIAVKYLVNVSSAENLTDNSINHLPVENPKDKLKIGTKLVAIVTSLPYIGKPTTPHFGEKIMETLIQPAIPIPTADEIPYWVWIVSAIVGILILFLLILCLYKCGFFKRNRPSAGPEREPLNRS